ncbi:MAG TPA: site-specific integrase [Jatrophihabitantaceae bacterium]|jgi:integrase
MASVEKRENKTTGPSWRVIWRENGDRQTELFLSAEEADRFRNLVEGSGNQWPHGWVKGHGFTGAAKTGAGLTFRDWAEQAVTLRTKATGRTRADYRRDLRRHVYPHLGALPVDGVTARDAVNWLDKMVAAELAPKTISNIHGLVSSIIADGMSHRPPVCDHNPFASRLNARPEVRVEEMVFLTPDEFELFYRHIPAFYKALTLLLWATGLRYGEATALRVGDLVLDGKRRTLTVVRAWKRQDGGTYEIGEPKTRRSRRTLPLSPKLAAALRPLVRGRQADAYVFPAKEGGQLLNSTFHDAAWVPAVRRARVCDEHHDEQRKAFDEARAARSAAQRGTGRRIRFVPAPCACEGTLTKEPRVHDMRHSHASQLIAEGLPLPVISRRLGHASIQVTIDRYGHMMPELDDAVNAAVDRGLAWLDEDV